MTGKEKCRALRAIREKIARENELSYPTDECHHQGKCSGTCPRCEQELADLTRQLEKRRSLGKRVAVAGLCLGMTTTLSACTVVDAVIDEVIVGEFTGKRLLDDGHFDGEFVGGLQEEVLRFAEAVALVGEFLERIMDSGSGAVGGVFWNA